MSDPNYSIEILRGEKYATAKCMGEFDEVVFHELIERMRKEVAVVAAGPRKILVDLRDTRYSIDAFARFRLGDSASQALKGLRLSVLGNPGNIDKLSENAAYNRGLKIVVTDDEAEAIRWLEK